LASFWILLVVIKKRLCEFREFEEPIVLVDEFDWLTVNWAELFAICINEITR
jgi:hypothetical protein